MRKPGFLSDAEKWADPPFIWTAVKDLGKHERAMLDKGEWDMKNRLFVRYFWYVSAALLIAACCPNNPPLDSAIATHGNTDWHIDTAEEFLFGTDMTGTTTAANHCPTPWTRRHINIGLTNTNHFYYDADLATPGDDTDGASGIETAMLFFHAGHGFPPPQWATLGNSATQANMNLGTVIT